MLANSAEALANLALHEVNRSGLVEEGAIRPLVKLCRGTYTNAVVLSASQAIGNLARDDPNRPIIVHEGGVPPLVQLLANNQDTLVLGTAAEALRMLRQRIDGDSAEEAEAEVTAAGATAGSATAAGDVLADVEARAATGATATA